MIHTHFGHFNGLSPPEDERLTLLVEECSEVIKAIAKIQRHGYETCHPDGGATNRGSLVREMGDVLMAMQLLCDACDIDERWVIKASKNKRVTVRQYLHHQPEELFHERR